MQQPGAIYEPSGRPDALDLAVERIEARRRSTRLAWHDDPVCFARDCIRWPLGSELAPYQADVLGLLASQGRVAVRSLHSVGKSTTAALSVIWFAVTREAAGTDWKAVTTAGAWRQLVRYLWPEIHLWARRLRWDVIGGDPWSETTQLLTLNLNLIHGSAFAVAASDPALIEGAHAESILYVFDEAKSIAPAIFDAAEGAFAGPGEVFALAQSTPGEPSGRFFDIHARKAGLEDWHTRHITLTEAIAAGRVTTEWSERRARQWGTDSSLYANRVLGEFHAGSQDSVIPLAWIEAANERWLALENRASLPVTHVGVDVARSGADQTCQALRSDNVILELRYSFHEDTMATTGRVGGVLGAHSGSRAIVDTDGLGAGVTDRLREQGWPVEAFHAGAGTDVKDRSGELGFLNVRSAAWWALREQLDPTYGPTLALPPDDTLIGDLSAPHWRVDSKSAIHVESKDDIRKRIGRSTDAADAVIQALWRTPAGQGEAFRAAWERMAEADAAKPVVVARSTCEHLWRRGICMKCQISAPEPATTPAAC